MPTAQLSVYFFLQAAVILLVCRMVGKLAQKVGQPQVVGEMIAGVTLGPSLLGWLFPELQTALFPKQTLDTLYVFAQFGVGLYMFLVGTEFRGDHFRARYRSALAVSVARWRSWSHRGCSTCRTCFPTRSGRWMHRCSSAPRSRSPRSRCWRGSSTNAG